MILIPESIKGTNTLALEQEWTDILMSLPIQMLKIDFDNETDVRKMTMWIDQFGVPSELIPESDADFELIDILKMAIKMYRIGGTSDGVEAIAEALGATDVSVHTGAYQSNKQRNNNSVSLVLKLPEGIDYQSFRKKFESLFQLFSPISLWTNDVKCRNGVFNNNFNSRFI